MYIKIVLLAALVLSCIRHNSGLWFRSASSYRNVAHSSLHGRLRNNGFAVHGEVGISSLSTTDGESNAKPVASIDERGNIIPGTKSPIVETLFRSSNDDIVCPVGWMTHDIVKRTNSLARGQLTSAMKLPHGKDEAWRHMNIRKLFAHNFKKQATDFESDVLVAAAVEEHCDLQCEQSCLVFINGRFSSSLSRTGALPSGLVATGLSQFCNERANNVDAQSDVAAAMETLLRRIPDAGELPRDSFASDLMTMLNYAKLDDAALLYAPAGVKYTIPVQVLFCNTSPAQAPVAAAEKAVDTETTAAAPAAYSSLLAFIGEGAHLDIKQSFITVTTAADATAAKTDAAFASEGMTSPAAAAKAAANFVSSSTRICVGENARCQHTFTQELSAASRFVEVLSTEVHHNASYDLSVLQAGATIGRVNAHIDLKQPEANCSLNAVHLSGDRQSHDLHSSITHLAVQCTSRQQQRNVVADRGETVFKGRIRIPKQAQQTNSAQLCRSIMLGQRARVIAMPTLEITADNVECSHGASVADMDENSMFYLASRGIDRQEARKLLLRAFVFDMLTDSVMDSNSKQRVVRKIESLYSSEVDRPTSTSGQSLLSI